jgi:hypothetical protein
MSEPKHTPEIPGNPGIKQTPEMPDTPQELPNKPEKIETPDIPTEKDPMPEKPEVKPGAEPVTPLTPAK